MEKTIDLTQPKLAESDVHKHIGAQLKNLRKLNQFSQEDMARELQISFQQYQKYESGTNRITPGKLLLLAHVLQVPVGSLFPFTKVQDYDPLPPRQLQLQRLVSKIGKLHPEEMMAIITAIIKISDKNETGE